MYFKTWQVKARLWLTVMHTWEVRLGIPAGEHSHEERKEFMDANNLFVGYVISVLADHLVDVYMHIIDTKELWDGLVSSMQQMWVVNCIPCRALMTSGW